MLRRPRWPGKALVQWTAVIGVGSVLGGAWQGGEGNRLLGALLLAGAARRYLAESTMVLASASKTGKLPEVSLECTTVGAPAATVTVTSKELVRPTAPLTSAVGIRAWMAFCRSTYFG